MFSILAFEKQSDRSNNLFEKPDHQVLVSSVLVTSGPAFKITKWALSKQPKFTIGNLKSKGNEARSESAVIWYSHHLNTRLSNGRFQLELGILISTHEWL
jgi:hypothetical protein